MLNHIVFFNIKEPKDQNSKTLYERFVEMPLVIKEIKEIKVGINEIVSERSCDLVLSLKFESESDLESYLCNPFHVSINEYIKTIKVNSYSVDYTD